MKTLVQVNSFIYACPMLHSRMGAYPSVNHLQISAQTVPHLLVPQHLPAIIQFHLQQTQVAAPVTHCALHCALL